LKRRVEELEKRLKGQNESASLSQELESIKAEESLRQAQADLKQKILDLQAVQQQVDAGLASRLELQKMDADIQHAEANLAITQAQIEKAKQQRARQMQMIPAYQKLAAEIQNELTHLEIDLKLMKEAFQAKEAQFKAGVITQMTFQEERAKLDKLILKRTSLLRQMTALKKQSAKQ
jgi:outer membrane protein TolC